MKKRWREILQLFEEQNNLTVGEISARIGLSEVMVRKYLTELDSEGLLHRKHGSASSLHDQSVPSFEAREWIQMDEKHCIAKEVSYLIHDGDSVIMDAGTTTLAVAKFIKHKKISIVTNSLPIGMELADLPGTVSLTGGDLISGSMALYGPDTTNFLNQIRVNKVILGTSGFRNDFGFTTSSSIEAAVKQKMIECAKEVIVALDHTKFTRMNLANIAPFSVIQTVVTSELAPIDAVKILKAQGIQVIIAKLSQSESPYSNIKTYKGAIV
ncbi:DeoR/GlpR family DNA-binding transcription regulator [Paenibacillus hamazuiensis]|uniref:DeoR/GlpR family DNA-binding transcription regulator n=1 Tax=Paenibacillus hamazuiensis TaxID=2936508 RepID=UPI00200BB27F|nr:DeoR/GlpR family DNA-binding transcription regulator [Paenibacillus hamazuiensis]